ncbi:MAG: hypothetical protein HUK08_03325 [Bacteroidaceae bacterium]|nr:hypothetical protein [Bacteroidaceae bacterium]
MRITTLLLSALISLSCYAQGEVKEGFYRVRNYMSKRVLYVQSSYVKIIPETMSANLAGIVPWLEEGKSSISDPQCVIYFKPIGDGYDFQTQGMSTYSRINRPIQLLELGNTGAFQCYATDSGMTLYLCDLETDLTVARGRLQKWDKNYALELRAWQVFPVSEDDDDNFFGIRPTIEANGKYYASFYAGFSFKVASPGMKVYTVNKSQPGYASLKDVTDTEISSGTPVIVECTSSNPSDNRLQLTGINATPINDVNKLTGVYFCNGENYVDSYEHKLITIYDPDTMRVVAVSDDGRLCLAKTEKEEYFVKGTWKKEPVLCIPANTAYLKDSPENLSDEMILLPEKEYDVVTAIGTVEADVKKAGDIYSITGTKVKAAGENTDNLPAGVYIINKKKVVVK